MTGRPFIPAALIGFAIAFGLFIWNSHAFLPFAEWPSLPFQSETMSTQQLILSYGLFPRTSVAIFAGASLGLAGALLQRLLNNPIAEPSTLGVSSGAQLAIVVATLFFPALVDDFRWIIAFTGASIATMIVFALGWRNRLEPVTMIVSGLLIGILCSAISAALTLIQGEYLMSLVVWNGGSLSQQDWSPTYALAAQFLLCFGAAIALSRPLTLAGLGENSARSLGVPIAWLRIAVILIAVILTANVAANVGLVSFIGLAAPAIVRGFSVRKPGSVLLASPFAGAILLWICDGAVQLFGFYLGETFPTGAVTALIGGPLLLWLTPRVRSAATHENAATNIFQRANNSKLVVLFVILLIAAYLALVLINTSQGWQLFTGADLKEILPLRWPRLLAVAAAGSLLAISGAILQRLTGNPLASPEVVGVSGGAGIGFIVALTVFGTPSSMELLLCASVGALLSMLLVLGFANQKQLSSDRLLLAGIAVGSLASAIISLFLSIGDQRSWQLLAWLSGSSAIATPETSVSLALLTVFIIGFSLLSTRWLTILPLGDTVSASLGLHVRIARICSILLACIASGAASILVGPLSFIGLMAPHMARRMGFAQTRMHLLSSGILGALLMVIADLGSRNAAIPYELPLGLFAALVGTPYLVWALGRKG